MLSDPQSVTYATVSKSLPKIGSGTDGSVYQLNDAGVVYNLSVTHAFAKRNRAIVRLRRDSFVTDPLVPANSIAASMSATLTVDFPTTGLTPADAQHLGDALTGLLTTSGLLARILGGET